eukprot:4942835-Pyramimonas_sp.AAC.1
MAGRTQGDTAAPRPRRPASSPNPRGRRPPPGDGLSQRGYGLVGIRKAPKILLSRSSYTL